MVVGFYVVQTSESILAKFLFTSTLSLVLTLATYEPFVRPFALTRLLFGMKPKPRAVEAPAALRVTPQVAVPAHAALARQESA